MNKQLHDLTVNRTRWLMFCASVIVGSARRAGYLNH
jgi:hypothetical protein